MEHRIVLQRNQNTPENQVIHRNKHECHTYTDLDSTDHNIAFKDTSKASRILMAPLKFGVFYSIESICKN
jgi:hypothetical protein